MAKTKIIHIAVLRESRQAEIKRRRRMKILVCLAVLTTVCAAVFAVRVMRHEAAAAASRREQASLPELPVSSAAPKTPQIVWSDLNTYGKKMRGVNPDYVGVMRIGGTAVSYPVARASDNVKYLSTSFGGAENPFGGLFMDYRCVKENTPHIIIYGHHAGGLDGNRYFFGALDSFLDEGYRAEHSAVTFIGNDYLSEFEIFSARATDTDDPAYHLDFSAPGAFDAFLKRNGAPPDAKQILTLSTCVGSGEDNQRIVVQGVRKNIAPIGNQMMLATYEYIPSNVKDE